MEHSRLLDKSQESKEATDLLAEAGKYHAATSRAYYAIYQKIIYILECNEQEVTRVHGRNIEALRNLLIDKGLFNGSGAADVANNIRILKEFRKSCDYDKVFLMDKFCYERNIKPLIMDINRALNAEVFSREMRGGSI